MCRSSMPLAFALAVSSFAGAGALAQERRATDPPPISRVAPVAASSVPPLTLAAALRIAVENSPTLSAARREIEATEGARTQAGVFPNPTLNAQLEDTRRDTRTTTLLLSQPIELGGKRGARIDAAERATDVARVQLEARSAELRADVTAAFFAALIAQERAQLAERSLALAAKGSAAASNRVQAGKVSPVEETRARVAEAGVRLELLHAQGELRTGLRQLQSLIARPMAVQALDGDAIVLPRVGSAGSLEARLAGAPALRQARLEVRRFAALAELERARRLPDITLTAGGLRDSQLGRNQAVVGVSISLPIFDTNRGNVVEALRRRDRSEDELAALELRLRADAGAALQRHETSAAELKVLQDEILPGAKSAFDAATTGFEFGKFAYLDVLDAQRTLLAARSQYLRALGEAHRAATDLDRLLGGPSPTP